MKKSVFFLLCVVFAFSLNAVPASENICLENISLAPGDSLLSMRTDTLRADSAARQFKSDTVRKDTVVKVVKQQTKTTAPVNVKSQKTRTNVTKKSKYVRKPTVSEMFRDSVDALYSRIFVSDSLCADTLPVKYNIDLYKLFFTPVLYSEPITRKMMPDLHLDVLKNMTHDQYSDIKSSFNEYTKVRNEAADTLVSNLLYYIYLNDFTQNYVSEEQLANYDSFTPVVIHDEEIKEKVFTLFKPERNYTTEKSIDANVSVSKPNFWKLQGNGSVQFSQNYISPNWYKGGESSNSILSYLMFNANYNDKQRIEFDNRIEAKVGFMTVPSDTIHKYNITSDLLRLTSKLGVKAFNRWYYTISAEFNTQFFNNYKVNTDTRVSSFMSPANLIINLGLDYKLSLPKIELSTLYSPLTYNFRYVDDPLVDPTQFGIAEGEKSLHMFGSSFQLNMRWTIIPSIIWESRFNYFTNYHKIETEWENTYNFVLNRYLSAKLFVHARFYDMEAEHKIQWNELLSFGINYNW